MSKIRVNEIETLDGKGEGLISYPYEADLLIESHNTVVRDGDTEYKLSESVLLPYTTTGAGLPEGGAFVTVGDAALRQELAASVATGQGALKVSGSVIYVDTIADLQALPTSGLVDGQAAEITQSSRAGGFSWRAGDQSGVVASDPQFGLYVPPSSDQSGLSGAWYRLLSDNVVFAKWWGVGDPEANQNTAIGSFLDYVLENESIAYLPNKTVTFTQRFEKIARAAVDIRGEGDRTQLVVKDSGGIWLSTDTTEHELSVSPNRYQNFISIPDGASINPGDVLFLFGSPEFETRWGRYGTDSALVSDVKDGIAYLNKNLRFIPTTIRVSKAPEYFNIVSVKLKQDGLLSSLGAAMFRLTYFKNITVRECSAEGQVEYAELDPFSMQGCVHMMFKDIRLKNCRYGILPTGGYDLHVENITGDYVRHPVAPSTWLDKGYIKHLRGSHCNGIMDCHPAFDVVYEDVRTDSDAQVSNHRGVGGGLINVDVTCPIVGTPEFGPYLQNLVMGDGRDIYADSNFVLRNVRWKSDNIPGVFEGGNVVIDNARWEGLDGSVSSFRISPTEENRLKSLSVLGEHPSFIGSFRQDTGVVLSEYPRDAKSVSGALHINPVQDRVSCTDGKKIRVYGTLFSAIPSSGAVTRTVRIYTHFLSPNRTSMGQVFGSLKLRAILRHSNAGTFDIQENWYHFYHKKSATSAIDFPATPAFSTDPTGQANESLTIGISSITQSGSSQISDDREHWVQFDVTLSSGRTNPVYGLSFELDLMI